MGQSFPFWLYADIFLGPKIRIQAEIEIQDSGVAFEKINTQSEGKQRRCQRGMPQDRCAIRVKQCCSRLKLKHNCLMRQV